MKSIDSNYRPHVDPGDFAFNLYLTDDMVDDGTAMYSLNVGSKKFMDVREMQENAELRSSTIASIMDIDRVGVGQLDDWKCFKGDDVYNLECVVPGAFNHISEAIVVLYSIVHIMMIKSILMDTFGFP